MMVRGGAEYQVQEAMNHAVTKMANFGHRVRATMKFKYILQYEPGSADGCKTESSKKSENTQQSWFGKPEHGSCS